MLYCARARDCGFEPGGLRDQPVGHVAAIAVAADSQVIGVGDALAHQRVHSFQNVLAGTRN